MKRTTAEKVIEKTHFDFSLVFIFGTNLPKKYFVHIWTWPNSRLKEILSCAAFNI